MNELPESLPAAGAAARPFKLRSGQELFQIPPDSTKWLVQGLLPAVGTSIVGASPKCGKSVLTRQLAAFVSMGLPFLGREVEQVKALYVSTQERTGPIVEHFRALGCTADTLPMVIANDSERIDPRTTMDRLDATVRDHPDIGLIVLDMVSGVLPLKDSNDYVEMSQKFVRLQESANRHKLHICATTHTKKAQTDNPVHSIIGSSAIAGAVDQLLCLSTDSRQQRYITTMQRYGESLPQIQMNWDSEKQAMYLGQNADEARAEQRKATEDRITQDMLVWVTMNPGRTRDEIMNAVKGDVSAKRKAFDLTKSAGHFVQAGTGQKGSPYTYTISDS